MISNKLVMPEHLNPFGDLFGGQMMSWIDKIAAMEAIDYTKRNCVTVKASEINFNTPVKAGDRVKLEAKVEKTGNSSLVVSVIAMKATLPYDTLTIAASAKLTFVAIGEDGKPTSDWEH